jgi:hypothetical protein
VEFTFGRMAGLRMTLMGLQSTYKKGLRESAEPPLDQVETVVASIQITEVVLSTLAAQPNKMHAALVIGMMGQYNLPESILWSGPTSALPMLVAAGSIPVSLVESHNTFECNQLFDFTLSLSHIFLILERFGPEVYRSELIHGCSQDILLWG